MKSFLVLAAIVMSSQAMSSEVLLKYTRGGGFTPFPNSTSVEVSENGEMSRTHFIKNTKLKEVLGKLAPATVQTLKDKIEAIADDAKLVDLDAKRPRCMDASSSTVTVVKGGKEIQISGTHDCHRLAVDGYEAESLSNFVLGLDFLGSK